MPKVEVNGVQIAYEVAGKGTPVVWTDGALWPRTMFTAALAGRLSAANRVLTWDRRNSGASGFGFPDTPSMYHAWVEDLHLLLLDHLHMPPAYLGGYSSGSVLSLNMAHRYPKQVKGLVLTGTGGSQERRVIRPVMDVLFLLLADAAERGGMQEAIAASSNPPDIPWRSNMGWLSHLAGRDAETREKILGTDPHRFAETLRRWAGSMMSGQERLDNLSDDDLRQIQIPALVVHLRAEDELHPREQAMDLRRLLPNSVWLDVSDRLTQEIQWSAPTEYVALLAPHIEAFLHRVEAGTFASNQ